MYTTKYKHVWLDVSNNLAAVKRDWELTWKVRQFSLRQSPGENRAAAKIWSITAACGVLDLRRGCGSALSVSRRARYTIPV